MVAGNAHNENTRVKKSTDTLSKTGNVFMPPLSLPADPRSSQNADLWRLLSSATLVYYERDRETIATPISVPPPALPLLFRALIISISIFDTQTISSPPRFTFDFLFSSSCGRNIQEPVLFQPDLRPHWRFEHIKTFLAISRRRIASERMPTATIDPRETPICPLVDSSIRWSSISPWA